MTRVQRVRWLWVVAVVVVIVSAAWVWRARTSTSSGQSELATTDMVGQHDMPGMNMSADGSIALTADQLRTFGVTFGDAEVRMLNNVVRAVGTVEIDETQVVQFAPRVGGFIERLYVNVTGQQVRRGDPLLELYSPEFVSAQDELLLAADLQRNIGRSAIPGIPENSTDLVAAARRRFRLWDVSDQQIDDILRTGRTRRTLTLYAPASGVITERKVVQGQAVMAGELLYTISDLSRVWVEAELRGDDVARVRVGTTANIEINGLPGREFMGRVDYVYPSVEANTRTTRARITVANTSGVLRPGMYATVRLSTPARSVLTVPTSAVVRTGERAFVFIDLGGGKLTSQDVELGATDDDYTEVVAGVEPGQRVVTSAQFMLDSESNLGEVMKSMLGMGGAAMDMKGADMKGMDMPGMDKPGTEMPGMEMPGMEMPGMKMPGKR